MNGEETHLLTKQESLLGRGAQVQGKELLCHVTFNLGFYGDGISVSGCLRPIILTQDSSKRKLAFTKFYYPQCFIPSQTVFIYFLLGLP